MSSSNDEYIYRWLQDSEASIIHSCRAHFNYAFNCGRELCELLNQLHPAVRAIVFARDDAQKYQILQRLPEFLHTQYRFSAYASLYNYHMLNHIHTLFEDVQVNLAAIIPLMDALRSLRIPAQKRR